MCKDLLSVTDFIWHIRYAYNLYVSDEACGVEMKQEVLLFTCFIVYYYLPAWRAPPIKA